MDNNAGFTVEQMNSLINSPEFQEMIKNSSFVQQIVREEVEAERKNLIEQFEESNLAVQKEISNLSVQLKNVNNQLKSVNMIIGKMVEGSSIESVLELANETGKETFGVEECTYYAIDKNGICASDNYSGKIYIDLQENSLINQMLESDNPLPIVVKDKGLEQIGDSKSTMNLENKNAVIVPFKNNEDELIGFVVAKGKEGGFSSDDIRNISSQDTSVDKGNLSGAFCVAVSKYQYKEKLEQKQYDTLTGLKNKDTYLEYIENVPEMLNEGQQMCMAIFDIDHFKNVNDTYGHDAGDEALKVVANAITNSLRDSDTNVFRFGGEEIAVFFPTNEETAKEICERVRKAVEAIDLNVDGKHIPLTISCGVSKLDKNLTMKENFERSDNLLYFSKENGRNQVTSGLDVTKEEMEQSKINKERYEAEKQMKKEQEKQAEQTPQTAPKVISGEDLVSASTKVLQNEFAKLNIRITANIEGKGIDLTLTQNGKTICEKGNSDEVRKALYQKFVKENPEFEKAVTDYAHFIADDRKDCFNMDGYEYLKQNDKAKDLFVKAKFGDLIATLDAVKNEETDFATIAYNQKYNQKYSNTYTNSKNSTPVKEETAPVREEPLIIKGAKADMENETLNIPLSAVTSINGVSADKEPVPHDFNVALSPDPEYIQGEDNGIKVEVKLGRSHIDNMLYFAEKCGEISSDKVAEIKAENSNVQLETYVHLEKDNNDFIELVADGISVTYAPEDLHENIIENVCAELEEREGNSITDIIDEKSINQDEMDFE